MLFPKDFLFPSYKHVSNSVDYFEELSMDTKEINLLIEFYSFVESIQHFSLSILKFYIGLISYISSHILCQ